MCTALACMINTTANAQITRNRQVNLAKTSQVSLKKYQEKINKTPRFIVVNPSDYGQIETVMFEDFSKFATGSEEEPDLDTNVLLDYMAGECEYPWWNVNPEYTTLPKWGGANLFPAGGKAYMLESVIDGQTHISTPLLDFTPYEGVAILEFKARTTNPGLSQKLMIEAAETQNMSPNWIVLGGSQATDDLTEEWKTYTAIFFGAGETTLFNIVPRMPREWYGDPQNGIDPSDEPCQILIDDFKAYSVIPYLKMPSNLDYKNYKGEEFDLTWDAVEGAESYTVSVWELDIQTGEQWEFVIDEPVPTNTYHVADAFDGSTYIFSVTAVGGGHKSFPSQVGLVCDLTEPVFIGERDIKKNEATGEFTFTSEWEEIASAEVYNYSVWHKRIAQNDETFIITEEDFTGLLDGDGNPTEFTIENPSWNCYGMLPIRPLNQPGWIGKSYMPFAGYITLDGWQHIVAKKDAYIASPELDLSKDNGKLHISVDLFGRIGSWYDPIAQKQYDNLQTKGAVSLYNYNEATDAFEQAEYVAFDDVTTAWNTFECDLTKGSARSFIVIEAIEGPDHLYIDDLCITQNYKKGEYLIEPCIYEYWLQDLYYDAVLPAKVDGEEIYEKLYAEKFNPIENKPVYTKTIEQALGYAGDVPSSIRDAAIANKLVSYANGMINVNNINGAPVSIYTADGKQIYSNNSGAAKISIPVSQNGIYMVKVGNKSVKFSI